MRTKSLIYIISGKNPLLAKSGYASYSYNLAKILTSLNYQVKIFCFGTKNQVIESPIGQVYISKSLIFSLLKDMEMAGLLLLAPKLSLTLQKELKDTKKAIIWGIGPWSLAGAFLKIFSGSRIILFSDYFTSVKHEFLGSLSGLRIKDHGLWIKLQAYLAYFTIIPLYTLLEQILLSLSNKIITHYQSTERILSHQFGFKKTKFIHLPYSV